MSGVTSLTMWHNRWTCSVITLACLCGLGSGCATNRDRVLNSSHHWPVAESLDTQDRLWAAAKETIRRLGYRLDRVDRRAGVISTLPEMSQQLFEFWRHDVDTPQDLWESAFNPIRRRVDIAMRTSLDEPGQMTLEVIVTKQRISSLDRQFNSTIAAYQFFGSGLPATTGQQQSTQVVDKWIDMGRDPAMEDYLLRQILQRAD